MKPKTKEIIKDTAVGAGIGCAVLVPGISGGTVALISGAFNKITSAVKNLFSKLFWKNFLILVPFGIGAIIGLAGLYFPITLAFDHCMFAIVCLFATFMMGSIPSIVDVVKKEKTTIKNVVFCIISAIIVIAFGILSLVYSLNNQTQKMFDDNVWYLYLILFLVGLISSMGIIVPGFSGSMLLMVIGFYNKILNLVKQIPQNPGLSFLRLGAFALGVIVGFIFFSIVMKRLFEKHTRSTNFVVLGFLIGSIIAIFINDQMFGYVDTKFNTLDYVLSPIFAIFGFSGAMLIYKLSKRSQLNQSNATN